MLLVEALATADCPICLQPLELVHSVGSSLHNTPHKDSHDSSARPYTDERALRGNGKGEFRITYGPDTYGDNSTTHNALHGGEGDTAVLACGHFLHCLCLMQLVEYQSGKRVPMCPVCRTELLDPANEALLFRPQTRPARLRLHGLAEATRDVPASATLTTMNGDCAARRQKRSRGESIPTAEAQSQDMDYREDAINPVEVLVTQGCETPFCAPGAATHKGPHSRCAAVNAARIVCKDYRSSKHTDAEEGEEDDITFVAARQVPLSEAYRGVLHRASEQLRERSATLHQRERDLRASRQQLEHDCAEVETSAADMERRCEMLTGGDGHSISGSGGSRALQRGAEERRQELLRVCKEAKAACDAATLELAAAVRESGEQQRTLASLARKMTRLRDPRPPVLDETEAE